MPNIWENGDQVTNDINASCNIYNGGIQSITVKQKTPIEGQSGTQSGTKTYYEYQRKPYPAPNPSHYAVVEAPGINRYVMRGCFKTSKDPGVPIWQQDNNQITICDDYDGTYCGGSLVRKATCQNDAPGGLADFTHPMPIHGIDFLKNGFIIDRCECQLDLDILKDKPFDEGCAILTSNAGNMPVNYTCTRDKRYRTCEIDWVVTKTVDECCDPTANYKCIHEGYKIGNKEYKKGYNISNDSGSMTVYEDDDTYDNYRTSYSTGSYNPPIKSCSNAKFGGSDWTPYQPSELWDGRIKDSEPSESCVNWYNPSIEDLPIDKKDKNNCTQYLMKWAKSCQWCKDNNLIGSNDPMQICSEGSEGCSEARKCSGECTDSIFSFLREGVKTCSLTTKQQCNICDSKLWDYIPGGWEALVDPNHPKHDIAKFSYIPKIIKSRDNRLQPDVSIDNIGNVDDSKILDYNNNNMNNKLTTTFTGLGPFVDEEIFGIRNKQSSLPDLKEEFTGRNDKQQFPFIVVGIGAAVGGAAWGTADSNGADYYNNQPNNLFNIQDSSRAGDFNWTNNNNISKGINDTGNPRCDPSDKSNKISYNYDGNSNTNYSVWQDIDIASNNNMEFINRTLENCTFFSPRVKDDEPPSAHTMCERNPNLTGYGECDKDTDYYGMLWIDGKWDLSKYTGIDKLTDEGLSTKELKQRRIEAMRCCLGLSPKYETKDNNYKSLPPGPLLEEERFNLCRPAFTAPSSDACKDLYNILFEGKWNKDEGGFNIAEWGISYPHNYSLKGSNTATDDEMTNSIYYTKAYCQMMSGNVDGVKDILTGCGHDFDTEVDCRKFTYNYCSTPTKVNVQDKQSLIDIGITDINAIEYPLRVFNDTCYNWCREDKLKDSLPGQKGVCDMAIGKTCQQLQVDGWIDPDNWYNSKILSFVDTNGNWTEENKDGTTITHTGLTAERLKNVCGCFLLGSECGADDCSIAFCGAGTNAEKGPGPISMNKVNWDQDYDYINNNKINKSYNFSTFNFPGGNSNPWSENIDPYEFSCYNPDNVNEQQCFTGCNYVNYNDTCWLASPEERPQNLIEGFNNINNINTWECDNDNVGDSCKTYNQKYGCFGYCSIDDYNNLDNIHRGQCGTDEWFNHKMNINPGEQEYKQRKSFYDSLGNSKPNNVFPNKSRSWTKWQNYYANWKDIPSNISGDANSKIIIPGWGSINTDSQGNPLNYSNKNLPICYYPSCANDKDSVKPYKYMKQLPECGNSCSMSIQNSVNNQGVVVGGIISSVNAYNGCNYQDKKEENWDTKVLNSKNNSYYIAWLGQKDCSHILDKINNNNLDCTLCTVDSPRDATCSDCLDLFSCIHGSELCINIDNGDNCNICNDEKPITCCVDPNLNPYDSQSNEYIQWKNANESLLSKTSNYINYICAKSCPIGTTPINELCNNNCKSNNKNDCESCDYCIWIESQINEGIDAHCAPKCPQHPGNGWGISIEEVGDYDSIILPTNSPDGNNGTTETTSPATNNISNNGIIIASIFSGLIGIIFIIFIIRYYFFTH